MCAQYGLRPVQYHFHMRLHAMHLLHCSKGAWDRQLKNNIHSAVSALEQLRASKHYSCVDRTAAIPAQFDSMVRAGCEKPQLALLQQPSPPTIMSNTHHKESCNASCQQVLGGSTLPQEPNTRACVPTGCHWQTACQPGSFIQVLIIQ